MRRYDPGRVVGRSRPWLGLFLTVGIAIALLAAPVPLWAQANAGWVGKRVVQKIPKFRLRSANATREPPGVVWVYRVERVEGDSLWLQAEGVGVSGWARADEVVPIEQAIDYFTEYIRDHPDDVYGYQRRATIRILERTELAQALADLNEAIRIDPTQGFLFDSRGSVHLFRQEYDRALADYGEAIRLQPQKVDIHYNRGGVWLLKGEYDRAIADFNVVIRGLPKSASAYAWRGIAKLNKQEYNQALADLNTAIRLDPKLAVAYGSRAWLLATCPNPRYRNGKKAIESATRACELSRWQDANYLKDLAAAHAEAGHFASAVKWETKAGELFADPNEIRQSQARLALYRARKPHRDPGPDRNGNAESAKRSR